MIEKYVHLQKRPWVLHEQEELCVLSLFAGARAELTLRDTVETQPVKTSTYYYTNCIFLQTIEHLISTHIIKLKKCTLYRSLPLQGLVPLPIIRNRSGWIVGGTGCEGGYDELGSPLASPLARTETSPSLEMSILEPRSIWREVAVKFWGAKGGIVPPGGGGKGGGKPMPGGTPLGGNGGTPGGIMGG